MMPTANPHRNEVRASNILYLAWGASLLLSLLGLFMVPALPGVRPPLFGLLLLVHLLDAVLYYFIRIGKPWAKYVLLALVGLTVASTGWSLLSGEQALGEDVWSTLKETIKFAADIVALVLLFRKPPVEQEQVNQ